MGTPRSMQPALHACLSTNTLQPALVPLGHMTLMGAVPSGSASASKHLTTNPAQSIPALTWFCLEQHLFLRRCVSGLMNCLWLIDEWIPVSCSINYSLKCIQDKSDGMFNRDVVAGPAPIFPRSPIRASGFQRIATSTPRKAIYILFQWENQEGVV